ncbi:DUF6383 domain-containing protein [uncultured Parabacteroides sp.]|uniref:DUF6383 domain-containing protein n=1 Tax=uncultured Parabacteroides sp. TaxID=512312 RepID=UPI0025D41470|nr:DUF6383 domain-containing protein [uncultured Parabacteroides sp.]
MNKRFSTLLAAALVAGSLSAYAATDMSVVTEFKAGKYYHLLSTDDSSTAYGLAVIKTSDNKADSLVIRPYAVGTTGYEAGMLTDDNALWSISESKEPVSGKKIYKFVNKGTNAVLSFDKDANKMKPILSGSEMQWFWDGDKLTNASSELAIQSSAAAPSDLTAAVKLGGGEDFALKAYQAKDIVMSADDLNGFYGDSFEFSDATFDENPFADVKFNAIAVNSSDASKGVYLQVIGATKTKADADDYEKAADKINPYVYMVADTILYKTSGFTFPGDNGLGYQFVQDTVAKADEASVELIADNGNTAIAPTYRQLDNYIFIISRNPGEGEGLGAVKIQVNTLAKAAKGTNGSEFEDATVYTTDPTFVAYGMLNNKAQLVMSSTKDLADLTFKAGTLADIDVEKAYIISDARQFLKQTSSKGNVRYVANPFNGDAFGLNCEGQATESLYGNADWKNVYASNSYHNNMPVLTDGDENDPTNQWVLVETGKGRYQIKNRVNSATFPLSVTSLYKVGEGVYATTTDTLKFTEVKNTSKYAGYKNFDNILSTYRVGIRVVSEGLGDDIFVVAGPNNTTKIKSGVSVNDDALMFYPEAVKAINNGVYGTDSLTYSLYALKSDKGYFNTNYLSSSANYAYGFKGTGDEYEMIVAERIMGVIPNNASAAATDDDINNFMTTDVLVVEKATGKIMNVFDRYAEWNAASSANIMDYLQYDASKTYGVALAAGVDDKAYEIVTTAYYGFPEEYASVTNDKVAATVTGTDLETTYKCNEGRDLFALVEADQPAYAKLDAPAHKIISTIADDDKAITMDADAYASLLRIDQALGEDKVVEDILKMYVDTASLANPVMPLYYIQTTRGLAKEDIEAGSRYTMVSLKDSANAKKYTKVNGSNYTRLGFVKAETFGIDSLVFGKAKADTVALSASPAAVAFQLTDNEGEYKLRIPNLTHTYKTGEKDEWGADIWKTEADPYNYVAVNNNVLYLTNAAGAYIFTLKDVDAPTSNGTISTSEVKVIAGNGNVQIAGAQGKKVVISNILGQVVANTVITSDNAVIAAPAGVVVVAVEGEEAVKAIVK